MRTGEDRPGTTVVICGGQRCRALRGRTDTGAAEGEAGTLLGALRERVRATRNAVLIRSDCLGACDRAPVVALLHPWSRPATGVLFGPVEQPAQVRAVLNAVRDND